MPIPTTQAQWATRQFFCRTTVPFTTKQASGVLSLQRPPQFNWFLRLVLSAQGCLRVSSETGAIHAAGEWPPLGEPSLDSPSPSQAPSGRREIERYIPRVHQIPCPVEGVDHMGTTSAV